MKKINKFVSFLLSGISLITIPLTGCMDSGEGLEGVKESGTPYESTYEYLYGICETPLELYPEVDSGLTAEWIADVCAAMGIKSYRIWAHMGHLFTVNEDDSLTVNQDYADRIHQVVATLEAAGVEKFSLLTSERLHLAEDSKYSNTSVADPTTDIDKYLRGLQIEEKAYEWMAKEFPNIDYYECINEPDHEAGTFINKNGYVYNPAEIGAGEYNFTTEETIKVCMDYCWYIRRGLQNGNPNAKLMMPALCHYSSSPAWMEKMYEAIYSKTLPAGQELSDTDPDNYFDVLNWHPYLNSMFGVGDNISEGLWVERQKEFHDVAVKYGDAEKPVWLTEFGFSDSGDITVLGTVTADGQTGKAPTNYVAALEAIKEELPWVETICMFRVTDMYNVKYDVATENTFGLFYNPDDPVNKGKPKPAAVAVARHIKGGSLSFDDMKTLCQRYYDAFGDIPEEYKCVVTQ